MMKRKMTTFSILLVLCFYCGSILAQEKRGGGRTADSSVTKLKVTTPHADIKVDNIKCIASGENVILEFTILNTGTELRDYRMDGGRPRSSSKAYDESGNEYRFSSQFGSRTPYDDGSVNGTLPSDVKVKIKTTIFNVAPEVEQFSMLRINTYSYLSSYDVKGYITFKNLPISR